MSKPYFLQVFAVIACVAAPSLAHLPGGLGFLGGGFGLPGIKQCIHSMLGVSGCVGEVISSFSRYQPESLGAACCKAFLEVDEDCWGKMFPLTTSFPSRLKNHCLDTQDCHHDDEDCQYY